MKKLLLILLLFPLTLLGQKFHEVKHESQADFNLYEVKYESQADVLVYKVKLPSSLGREAHWYFYEKFPPKEVNKFYTTHIESQADIKVFYVKYPSSAKWRNEEKKRVLRFK